jgi:hypothetical protein
MPEAPGPAGTPRAIESTADQLGERIKAASHGLRTLLNSVEAVQRQRAADARRRGVPRWTDVFTTQFTEFSNRPR